MNVVHEAIARSCQQATTAASGATQRRAGSRSIGLELGRQRRLLRRRLAIEGTLHPVGVTRADECLREGGAIVQRDEARSMRALFVEHDTLDRLREWVVISFVGSANRAEGFVQGHAEGLAKGLSQGRIEMLCTLLGIPLGPREHEHLQSLNVEGLATLLAHLESERRWP